MAELQSLYESLGSEEVRHKGTKCIEDFSHEKDHKKKGPRLGVPPQLSVV
jgi:hypothetical protein